MPHLFKRKKALSIQMAATQRYFLCCLCLVWASSASALSFTFMYGGPEARDNYYHTIKQFTQVTG